jgi:hypothetical protein
MSRDHGSVIVEFVGMPGSGKSTLAHATAELLRARGLPVSEPTYVLDHQTAGGLRQLRKLSCAARALLARRRSAVAFAAAALRSGQRHPGELASVTLNWWYLLDVHRRALVTPGVHLLDQGLLQALWSLGYGARHPKAALDAAPFMLPRAARYVVVSLRVGTETALDRLRARPNGASRVDREVEAGRAGLALARARMMADAIDSLAGRLANAGVLTVVHFDNEGADVLGSNASALADRLAMALTSARPSPVSPAPRAG